MATCYLFYHTLPKTANPFPLSNIPENMNNRRPASASGSTGDVDISQVSFATLIPPSEGSYAKTPDGPGESKSTEEVHMLVTSRNLTAASPVFQAMLGNDSFQEGKTLHSTGKLLRLLPDDEPAAMIVHLNILYFAAGKSRGRFP